MNADYSFEDFFDAGTGSTLNENRSFVVSTEGLDGYTDDIVASIEQGLEELNFLDYFEAVSRKNADEKIRMLKKIKNNYNSKTVGRENLGYSIESYCDSKIQSLEDALENPNTEKEKTPSINSAKKDSFFKIVWQGIKSIFKRIADFFADIGKRIIGFFRTLKKPAEIDSATITEVSNGLNSDEKNIISTAGKASVLSTAIENVRKFDKYASDFNKISKRVSDIADKMSKSKATTLELERKAGYRDENGEKQTRKEKYNEKVHMTSVNLQKTVSEFLKKSARIQMLYGQAFTKLSKAIHNSVKLNNMLENFKKAKENRDKTDIEIKDIVSKKFLKQGDLYICGNGNVDLTISNQLLEKSKALSMAVEQFVNNPIKDSDEQKVIEIRKISEDINKLILGDKANYSIQTIEDSAFTVSKLFGIKISFVKGNGTVLH